VAAIESTGGLDYTARLAREELERALSSLGALPHSSYKDGLGALARFIGFKVPDRGPDGLERLGDLFVSASIGDGAV